MNEPKHLFIVGAGFSWSAGLPLAAGFTEQLLDVSRVKTGGASHYLVDCMRAFVNHVFGNGSVVPFSEWPQLEDLFTTIDLAANTGHNLGADFSASDLRAIRRVLITRLIRMLRISFNSKKNKPKEAWPLLNDLFSALNSRETAFLSMNWDTVIEELLLQKQGPYNIDYGCGAIAASISKSSVTLRTGPLPSKTMSVLKPHGSVNWMYCDSCSRLYWFEPSKTELIASHLFKKSDAAVVKRLTGISPLVKKAVPNCPDCTARALGTRFATFSYRKALEFPMHQATWNRAEELLRESETWIFIGYSMPAADYQFKHLLKRVHLSRLKKPELLLITKTSLGDTTVKNYRRFFGGSVLSEANVLLGGIDRAALNRLREVGALL